MTFLFSGIFSLVLINGGQAQKPKADGVLIIEGLDLSKPGRYYFKVEVGTSGAKTVTNISGSVVTVDGGTVAPNPPGGNDPPANPTGLSGKIVKWVKDDVKGEKKYEVAAALYAVYGLGLSRVEGGRKTVLEAFSDAVKLTDDLLKGKEAEWKPFRDNLKKELNDLARTGKLNIEALKNIVEGLKTVVQDSNSRISKRESNKRIGGILDLLKKLFKNGDVNWLEIIALILGLFR